MEMYTDMDSIILVFQMKPRILHVSLFSDHRSVASVKTTLLSLERTSSPPGSLPDVCHSVL